MAEQAGRKMLLELSDEADSPAYTLVGGCQNATLSDNVSEIDVSIPDATNPGNPVVNKVIAGKRTLGISGVFTLQDSAVEATLRKIMASDDRTNGVRVTIPESATYIGAMLFTEFQYEGAIEGAVQFTIAGVFSGAVTIAEVGS